MKQTKLHLFTLLILALTTLSATAHDFYVDGIYYNINGTEASVTYRGPSIDLYNSYQGHITIPETVTYNGTTYPVTSIGCWAFHDCSSLIGITIPNSVTSINEWAFYKCSDLNDITIPNSVISIGDGAFYSCSCMTSINIPNSVTSIGNEAFAYCDCLHCITIPNSVISIGDEAFVDCSGLTSITIPSSVTSIGEWAFGGCNGLTSMKVEDGNPVFDSRNNSNAIIETNTNTLIAGCMNTIIPNSINYIGDRAFSKCSGLTSISIPNSVTYIGKLAFNGCSSLTSVTIPNSVTDIDYGAFSGCHGLNSITISNSVTSIGEWAFSSCSGLTSISIPNSVTYINEYAFSGCSGLTSIVVESGNPNYDSRDNSNAIIETNTNNLITGCMNTIIPNSITSIGEWAFYGCSGLTSITIPNSVTFIGELAFWGCRTLASITCLAITPPINFKAFSSDVTSHATLYVPRESLTLYQTADYWKDFSQIDGIPGFYGFEVDGVYYQALDKISAMVTQKPGEESYYQGNVVIPAVVTYQDHTFAVIAIDEGAFADCYDLASVVIGDAVETIGENAFQGCTGLTSVTIGSGVTSIGAKAFNYCNALTTVTCRGTVPPVMANANCFSNAAYSRATLLVPRQQLEAYQAADYWYRFSNIEGWGSCGLGDVNADGIIGISDVTALTNALLTNSTDPALLEYGDLNHNGRLDIGDVTNLIVTLLTH